MNTPTETKPRNPVHGYIWPGLVVLLLAAQALFLFVSVSLATRDPSFAVENDYYEKALHWDQQMAEWRAVEQAGWTITPSLADDGDVFGDRTLILTLLDAERKPVVLTSITGELFPHAAASRRQPLELTYKGDGRYAARVRMRDAGWWQLRLTMQLGDKTLAFDQSYLLYSLDGGEPWSR